MIRLSNVAVTTNQNLCCRYICVAGLLLTHYVEYKSSLTDRQHPPDLFNHSSKGSISLEVSDKICLNFLGKLHDQLFKMKSWLRAR